jgi:hypothetical protein
MSNGGDGGGDDDVFSTYGDGDGDGDGTIEDANSTSPRPPPPVQLRHDDTMNQNYHRPMAAELWNWPAVCRRRRIAALAYKLPPR